MKIKSKSQKSKFKIFYSVLLYYSTILSTILIIGGFYSVRNGKEIISNLLFLPIMIFLWIVLVQKRKEEKEKRDEQKEKIKLNVRKTANRTRNKNKTNL